MTEEIAASDAGIGKGAFGFMRDAAEAAVSSPEARAALSSCENFMAFERGRGGEGNVAGAADRSVVGGVRQWAINH